MAGRSYDDDEPITGINVTPLVDIVLVLLIIFMVTSEVIHEQDRPKVMPIELPSAASAQEMLSKGMLSVVVLQTNELIVNDIPMSMTRLEAEVDRIVSAGEKPQVLISSDKRVPFGTVAALMDFFRLKNVTDLAFNTKKQEIE